MPRDEGRRKVWRRATEKSNVVLASVVPLSRCRRARARAPSRRLHCRITCYTVIMFNLVARFPGEIGRIKPYMI
eukprot:scaffold12352_cov63-Phaeocystis_antarctica.AAC.1